MPAPDEQRVNAPTDQEHRHDGGELHNPDSLFAGLLNPLDVLPPEIERHTDGESCSRGVRSENDMRVKMMSPVKIFQYLVKKSSQILSSGYAAYRAGENVVEHERGDGELGQGRAHGLLDHAVHAAPDEHAAALEIHLRDGVSEEHHSQDEPGSGRPD